MTTRCAPSGVCAVIVTFHPDSELPARIERVAPQVGRIVIVDNGSEPAAVGPVRELATRLPIDLIANNANLGVATALNQGVDRAREQGFEHVLLLDQDTVVGRQMTETLCRALLVHPAPHKVAVVGSNYVETANGRRLIETQSDSAWIERLVVITSGSLISVAAFEAVGRFRDDLFIDEVDTEFCLRARSRGYDIIATTEVTMEHTIGDAHAERRFLWRTARPVNYSPVRWYYIARNTVVLAREYGRTHPGWVSANAYGHLKWLAKAILYEPQRGAKASEVVRGVLDGLRGRLGPSS